MRWTLLPLTKKENFFVNIGVKINKKHKIVVIIGVKINKNFVNISVKINKKTKSLSTSAWRSLSAFTSISTSALPSTITSRSPPTLIQFKCQLQEVSPALRCKTRSERKPIIVELSIGQSIFCMLQWETAVLAGQQIAKRPRICDSLHYINKEICSDDGSSGGVREPLNQLSVPLPPNHPPWS